MKIINYLFVTFLVSSLLSCAEPPAGQVKVEGGVIQGVVTEDLTIYKGIPFAAPPVGDLRWKAPQPVEEWEGVKQTTEYAPAPMQGGNPASGKSEDCLYLNVWTPAKSPEEKLPVLGTNFAKNGNPDGEGVPEWPAFSNENPKVMHLRQTAQVGDVPSAESLEVLNYRWRRSPEGQIWAQ